MELFKDIEQQLRELVDPALDPMDARVTSRLATMQRAAEALERVTRETVEAARQQGKSWEVIGEYLGISKQAAHQRFKDHIREPGASVHLSRAEVRALIEQRQADRGN